MREIEQKSWIIRFVIALMLINFIPDSSKLRAGVLIVGDTNRDGMITPDDVVPQKSTSEGAAIFNVNLDRDEGRYLAGNPATVRFAVPTSTGEWPVLSSDSLPEEIGLPDAIGFEPNGRPYHEDYRIRTEADINDITPFKIFFTHKWKREEYKLILRAVQYSRFGGEMPLTAAHVFSRRAVGEAAILGNATLSLQRPEGPYEMDESGLIRNPYEVDITSEAYFSNEEKKKRINLPWARWNRSIKMAREFGIEGLFFRFTKPRDRKFLHGGLNSQAPYFDGFIRLTVRLVRRSDGVITHSDTMLFQVAPWMALPTQNLSEKAWILESSNSRFIGERPHANAGAALTGTEVGLMNYSGTSLVAPKTTRASSRSGYEVWLQDHVEIGYTERPGVIAGSDGAEESVPAGRMHMVLRTPYGIRESPIWPEKTLLNKDVGVFSLGSDLGGGDFDFGGNLESFQKRDGTNFLVMGGGASDTLVSFLQEQDGQQRFSKLNMLSVQWLAVGHLDEVVSFVGNGKVLISDSLLGWKFLEQTIADDDPGVLFCEGVVHTGRTTGESKNIPNERDVVLDIDDFPINFKQTIYIRFYARPDERMEAQESDAVQDYVGLVGLVTGYANDKPQIGRWWYLPVDPNIWKRGSVDPVRLGASSHVAIPKGVRYATCTKPKVHLIRDDKQRDETHVLNRPKIRVPSFITAHEIVHNSNLQVLNQVLVHQQMVSNKEILISMGVNEEDIISVPMLYKYSDLQKYNNSDEFESMFQVSSNVVTMIPNMVNLQKFGTDYYVPKPYAHKADSEHKLDYFETEFISILGRNNILGPSSKAYFVDDWLYYINLGDVHCASNVKRKIPTRRWWD